MAGRTGRALRTGRTDMALLASLARIAAATLRAAANEMDPKQNGSRPARDAASTTAARIETSPRALSVGTRPTRRGGPRPIGFGPPS